MDSLPPTLLSAIYNTPLDKVLVACGLAVLIGLIVSSVRGHYKEMESDD